MKFTKMHGTGNDYIYINCFSERFPDNPGQLAAMLSDRHFGIGSDGLIFLCPSETADFEMIMYNADGSRSQMCGNGIRCAGKLFYDSGLTKSDVITVQTQAGIKTLSLNVKDGFVDSARVKMGVPDFDTERLPMLVREDQFINLPLEAGGFTFNFTAVSIGNPHIITFVDDINRIDLLKIGPLFENHRFFPERVNVEFAKIINDSEVEMRVWERGSGETLSCGTGACATLAAAVKNGLCGNKAKLHILGGALDIEWVDDSIFMTGEAVTVFTGDIKTGE